ncbi:MAG: glycosyltransferase family 4 protein [Bacteroidia bacterium]|nr:glycosyltransferase family 4 protein [Bacteroidia bacterium]
MPYIAPFVGRLYNGLKSRIEVDLFHFEAKRSLKNYLKARRRIKALLASNQYDIIHINWGQTIAVIPFFIKSKLIVSYRGSDVYGIVNAKSQHDFISRIVNLVSRFAAYRSDACIYVSKELRDYLPTKRLNKIIPSGVDTKHVPETSKTELRKEFGFEDNEIVVLFVGNARNARKRMFLAEKIVSASQEEYPIKFIQLWRKTPQEIFKYMKAADFLFQVSMQEGSPNIVKEALSCNLSVISTPVGDTPSRIGHLANSYISNGYDEQAIQKTFNEALSNFKRERSNDYSSEVSKFSIQRELDEVIDLYHQVLNQ